MTTAERLPLDLDAAELHRITGRTQYAAQARFLERMRVPYTRRPDGSLLVGRLAMQQAMLALPAGSPAPTPVLADNDDGIKWKVAQ
jgi:hypothetical protein